jgi:nucleoside-diphosphate-sugar epimerase
MKILLVGGGGFIGAHLSRLLLERGHEVHIYDAFLNFDDPFHSHYGTLLRKRFQGIRQDVHIQRGDIRAGAHVYRYVTALEPEVIVHLAAVPVARLSAQLPEMVTGINIDGLINVLETMRSLKTVKRFLFFSSSFVYGHFQYSPADEEHPTRPIDAYGGTKLTGEVLTRSHCLQNGVPYVIIRPSSVYGPGDPNRRIVHLMIEKALAGQTIPLHNGGESLLDFTHVRDLVRGVYACITEPAAANEVFNLTRGRARKVRELAEVIRRFIPGLQTETVPADHTRPERGTLDISKARRLLGYEPHLDLEDGIEEMVEEARALSCLQPT